MTLDGRPRPGRSAGPQEPPAERVARLLAHTVTALGAVAILGTLLWAMHEDTQHELRREAMAQQARVRQPPAPSAEQRRHVAAQFVCGHGVAYQWVNANTVECLREMADAQVATTGR
ncbi:hypothetical protein HNP48_006800 [Acidovorax soli]|uniref:Uncharacterized protein n=1 Tax=Acidovorax soli TaxID=592050 RepID=A0A7X0UDH2_9BURK|nr:hypothetical protein [Acidovorax soli]MBB6564074.1 hypothetical protein [Acidovorax soli]